MMTQARRTNRRVNSPKQKLIGHGLREIVLIFFGFVALYLFVSLLTYYGGDPGWSHSGPVEEVRNKGGVAGALFADIFFYLFGYFAYLFPIMVGYTGWLIYKGRHHDILAEPKSLIVPGIGFVLTLSAGCGLAIVHFMAESALLPTHAGGILGLWIGNGLVSIVDRLGATLILLAIFFTGVTLLTGLSWLKLMDTLGYHTLLWLPVVEKYMSRQFLPWFLEHSQNGLQLSKKWSKTAFHKSKQWSQTAYTRWQIRRAEWRREREEYDDIEDDYDYEEDDYYVKDDPYFDDKPVRHGSLINTPSRVHKNSPSAEMAEMKEKVDDKVDDVEERPPVKSEPPLLPALSLLDPLPAEASSPSVKALSRQMVEAFTALQVEVTVNAVHPGPVLIGFEIQTITPINVSHLDELQEALAQVLRLDNVKVVETQPGILSVEIPNSKRQTIYLTELLNTPEYQNNLSQLTVALGQDINGQPIVVDLTRIPHILMAGQTLSEKTMAMHTLILSLLFKSTPEQVRFLFIDSPDQELQVYAELPHLLFPLMTEVTQVVPALRWCVQEMERRYRLMASQGVRNIEAYNQTLVQEEPPKKNSRSVEEHTSPLFYIVIMIAEMAELMTAQSETKIEGYITSLAQKARAAGIHIILSTQHPSVNVITGLIKANIPTRIAFQVKNKSESRTILGQMGAETLLGEGDMLYMTAGTGLPVRVHGSFVSDHEVQNVVNDLKERAIPEYVHLGSHKE